MPAFVFVLLGGLVNIAATLAGRVLISLGFASITYTGLSLTLTALKGQVITNIQGLGSDLTSMLSYMKVGEALSIVTSAIVVRMVLDGLSAGGAISKLVKQ